jgi:hypothetical protein
MTEQHPAITAYEQAIAGIPDTFDCFTAQSIRDWVDWANKPLAATSDRAHHYVRSHFDYLDTWRDALDGLDSDLRAHVVEGPLPWDQAAYLKQQALALFDATTALQRAVCEYHHGVAGPALDPAYGHAYALSNSAVRPF